MNDTSISFTFNGRARSMRNAVSGIRQMLISQHNAWVHGAATGLVVCAGWSFGVSPVEWCLLVLVIAAVWTAEALNTAVELLGDVASQDFHPLIKKAKDIAAGAVLLSALGAVAIGLIIFVPYLDALW